MIRFSVARLEKEPIELVGSEPAEFLEKFPVRTPENGSRRSAEREV